MTKPHYARIYFEWQKKASKYGAQQDLWMYENYIKDKDTVLDFGCGGGYMLEKLKGRNKYGVDINPYAMQVAAKKGIKVFAGLDKIPKKIKFDVILSHHTLEHVPYPFEGLKKLRLRLKQKGILICVVPIDDWRSQKKYVARDINKHMYTWTPLLLGNLFSEAGFRIKKIEIISRAWLPLSRIYYDYFPKFLYNFCSEAWSSIIRSRQIRIIAARKTS